METKSAIIGGEIFGKGGGGGTPATWSTLSGKPFNDVDSLDFEVKYGRLMINRTLQVGEDRVIGEIDGHYLYERIDDSMPPYAVIAEEHPMLNYTDYKYFNLNEGLGRLINGGHLESLMDTYVVRSDELPPNFYEDPSNHTFNFNVLSSGCGGIIYSRNKINFDNINFVMIDFARSGISWNQTYLALVRCDPRELQWDDWTYYEHNPNITVLQMLDNTFDYENRYIPISGDFSNGYLVLFSATTGSVDQTMLSIREMKFILR